MSNQYVSEGKPQYYIEKFTKAVRDELIDQGILIPQEKLSIETAIKILKHFGGEVKKIENNQSNQQNVDTETYLVKGADDKFTVYYSEKKPSSYILSSLIHELSHVLFDLKNTTQNKTIYSTGIDICDIDASRFARAFIMPKDSFLESLIKNTSCGQTSVRKIAEDFGTSYFDALTRGQELNIWK